MIGPSKIDQNEFSNNGVVNKTPNHPAPPIRNSVACGERILYKCTMVWSGESENLPQRLVIHHDHGQCSIIS